MEPPSAPSSPSPEAPTLRQRYLDAMETLILGTVHLDLTTSWKLRIKYKRMIEDARRELIEIMEKL